MLAALRRIIVFSNSSHECENATRSNTAHLNELFGLKAYKVMMICLPMLNCLLNSLCCKVFRWMKPNNQFNRILMYLSIAEVLFQLMFASHQLLFLLMETNSLTMKTLLEAQIVAGSIVASIVLLTACHLMRNWMVVLISYYRYCSASVPSIRSCLFTSHLRVKSACLVSLCLLVALPRCLEFSIVVCSLQQQVTHIDSNLSDTPLYRMLYLGVILFLAQNVGPVMLLLVFSICLCHILYRQRRLRQSMQSRDRGCRERRNGCEGGQRNPSGTRLVIVLCAVFLTCEIPTLLKVIDPMRTRLHLLGYTTNLLTCVDSTLNIIVYYLSNREFKRVLRQRLPCWFKGESGSRERQHMITTREDVPAANPTADEAALVPLVPICDHHSGQADTTDL